MTTPEITLSNRTTPAVFAREARARAAHDPVLVISGTDEKIAVLIGAQNAGDLRTYSTLLRFVADAIDAAHGRLAWPGGDEDDLHDHGQAIPHTHADAHLREQAAMEPSA